MCNNLSCHTTCQLGFDQKNTIFSVFMQQNIIIKSFLLFELVLHLLHLGSGYTCCSTPVLIHVVHVLVICDGVCCGVIVTCNSVPKQSICSDRHPCLVVSTSKCSQIIFYKQEILTNAGDVFSVHIHS